MCPSVDIKWETAFPSTTLTPTPCSWQGEEVRGSLSILWVLWEEMWLVGGRGVSTWDLNLFYLDLLPRFLTATSFFESLIYKVVLFHTFIRQILIEHLLCACTVLDTRDKGSKILVSSLLLSCLQTFSIQDMTFLLLVCPSATHLILVLILGCTLAWLADQL